MKKTFEFGKIDYYGTGRHLNAVTVEVEYCEQNNGKKEFTASAMIWNNKRTDCVCGGQCLDEIAQYITHPIFKEIYRLWKLYHLNGMHPECPHQNEAGWSEKAKRKVNLYKFTLTTEALTEQNKIKQTVLHTAIDGEALELSEAQRLLLSLNYSHTSPAETLPDSIAPFYKLKEVEAKTLGWLKEDEHPEGILCKPCPVCGYKYGTSWVHFPIPENDEKAIYKLFEMEA
jgi:hypothetical protein